MDLKYQTEIEHLPQCPPDSYECREMSSAYRWVFSDIANPKNFQPPLVSVPQKISHRAYKSKKRQCGGHALSFFETLDNAKSRYLQLMSALGSRFASDVGNCVALGAISPEDGLCSDSDKHGHFELHEFVDANLASKFEIVEVIDNDPD